MGFNHPLMLVALGAMLVPIILHLLNRRSAKLVDWGAMQFLLGSLVSRRRRLLLEEMMLLAMRCLLFALVALVVAQPFVRSDSQTPWMLVLPAILLGAVALGVGTAFWCERAWRWRLWGTGCALLLLAGALVTFEEWLHLSKKLGPDRDVAIVIDCSDSMNLKVDGQTNFHRAVEEAQTLVHALGKSSTLTVVLAGAAPRVVTPQALTRRDEMEAVLKDLKPLGGSCSLRAAVQEAWRKLQEAPRQDKQIIVYTDQQKDGWDIDDATRWQETALLLKSKIRSPQVLVRSLPLPKSLRNVSIVNLSLSRDVVGADRPVSIEVQVKNTGTEAISAAKVLLLVDGKFVEDKLYSRLNPSESAVVTFSHRFDRPGARIVEVRIAADDDLADDDSRLLAVRVLDRLPVLLVSGNDSTELMQQASAFMQLALTPDDLDRSAESPGENAPYKPLVAVTVVDAADVSHLQDFKDYRVVVLCDVPRLSEGTAARLAKFVSGGGGLLVAPGGRAEPEFYNGWQQRDGHGPLLPALMESRRTLAAEETPVHLALSTFAHPALSPLGDDKIYHLSTAIFHAYWKLASRGEAPLESGGNFTSGDPLLVQQRVGTGTVILLATSLDVAGSNLASQGSFPVLANLLIYHLADAGRGNLTHQSGPETVQTLPIETGSGGGASSPGQPGLQGEYFSGNNFDAPPAATRIDPQIDFRWVSMAPLPEVSAKRFAVRWTGVLVAPKSDDYRLLLSGMGIGSLSLDGEQRIHRKAPGTAETSVFLQAGTAHSLVIEEIKRTTRAAARLEWESSTQQRQVVPPSALFHAAEAPKGQPANETFVVTPPDGRQQRVEAEVGEGLLTLKLPKAVAPGVYYARPPESFNAMLVTSEDERHRVPLVLTTNPREFNFARMGDDDWKSLSSMASLIHEPDAKTLVADAVGRENPSELWKYLALAALVLLIAEIAVTRWIALQRQVTFDPIGDFDRRNPTTEAPALHRYFQSGGAAVAPSARSTAYKKATAP